MPDSARPSGYRVPAAKVSLRLMMTEGDTQVPVSIVDVSVSGGRLVSNQRLGDVDDRFNIEFHTNPGMESVCLPCTIRYIREVIEGSARAFHHGVAFVELDDPTRVYLERFVRDSITAQRT